MARKIMVPSQYRGTPMETRCYNYLTTAVEWRNSKGGYDLIERWQFIQTQVLQGYVPIAYPRYDYDWSRPEYYLINDSLHMWCISKFEYYYAEMLLERFYG